MASTYELKNKYWVLRHGRSIPNQKGLIVSHPSNGILDEHGLTWEGMEQAREAGVRFREDMEKENIAFDNVQIFCSPFSRTKDTARAVLDVLQVDSSKLEFLEDLRERYFGTSFELQSHDYYPKIWELDACNPFLGPDGGESAADVARRMIKVIVDIESKCCGCAVLIVSHGDPLQILQTVIHGAPSSIDALDGDTTFHASILSQHRKYTLSTGELRRVV